MSEEIVICPSPSRSRSESTAPGLRSSAPGSNDLGAAIRAAGEEVAAEKNGDGSAALNVIIEGTPRAVYPILRDEICRIASEALRNAFHHAQARQIEVGLRYDKRQLRLWMRDDGRGIDPRFLGKQGRAAHYGLQGMYERAKLIGGTLTVWSALDSGTEIELTIPASRAYGTRDWPGRSAGVRSVISPGLLVQRVAHCIVQGHR